ncbi:DUF4118 domain-containing protein [Photobacterium ganghwense]|uniref:DUF4118 domain-containing protein n=1 Tax=Photobacterium ganghwense TaxID=320778 RepID=UPI001A8D292E|nr:DUF4118 domain-containing protein [Photobacterium ganghwense]QSV14838.1 DUF4118 domain-containing protein [Photobacterium ganghwense]
MEFRPGIFSFSVIAVALLISCLSDYLAASTAVVLLILQLGVVLVAMRVNRRWACLGAICSALSFNYFFTAPRYSFQMFHLEDVVNLGVFLLVALIISQLASHFCQTNPARSHRHRYPLLSAQVSSDLQTSLAAVNRALEKIHRDSSGLNRRQAGLLHQAITESWRLQRHLQTLGLAHQLALAVRGNTHVQAKNVSSVAMVPLLHRVMAQFPGCCQRLVINADTELPAVQGDPALLELAVANVMDTLLAAVADNTALCISLSAEFHPAESALGLPEMLTAEFQGPFSHHAFDEDPDFPASGLAIARAIIRDSQGCFELFPAQPDKEKEQDTVLRVWLPISQRPCLSVR